MNDRQKKQMDFHNSNENIIIGDQSKLPISINLLKDPLKLEALGYVEKIFDNGLTATVYKLNIDSKTYNLKIKRETSLVKNIDGQTSYLNEIQRRRDFEMFRISDPIIDAGIVKTIYADYRLGIMLSEWIDGFVPVRYTRKIIKNLFKLTWSIEKNGVMEWDLCSGNLLVNEQEDIFLFDFGYMYSHNPLTDFNSEGKSNPLFNSVERFETRAFLPYLLNIKDEKDILKFYKIEKEEAVDIFKEKIKWLISKNADVDIIEMNKIELDKWSNALKSNKALSKLYALESLRSYVLDIHDDISGKSCSKHTIQKIDEVMKIISSNHDFLSENNGYLWDDIGLSKIELLVKYNNIRELANKYQL